MSAEGKRKGLGGLSPEKREQLKKLIMQRVKEELKNEAIRKMEERENYVNQRIKPLPHTDDLNDAQLKNLCQELYALFIKSETDHEEWESKIAKQQAEINELQAKVNDVRGRFIKPVLKKVSRGKDWK